MNISIVCVCYNSYPQLLGYIESIVNAFDKSEIQANLEVVIVDNSTNRDSVSVEQIKSKLIGVKNTFYESHNVGYFPAVKKGLGLLSLEPSDYDYVLISNVDIKLSEDFFIALSKLQQEDNIGVYAPSIITDSHGADLNPKVLYRPSKNRLKLYKFIFSNSFLYYLLVLTNSLKKILKGRTKKIRYDDSARIRRRIYAAHGSIFLLTKSFFKKTKYLDYPMFLFGEEIYIAEIARRTSLEVIYCPELVIHDSESVSTSTIASKVLRDYHVTALNYLLSNYFSDENIKEITNE